MEYLSENHIRQSFSRVGKPGDNAWSESFFANLKKEAVYWRHFKTREEARQGKARHLCLYRRFLQHP
jgi:transposase InsO family protein